MGLEAAAFVMAGISVASAIGQAEMQSDAADSKQSALDLESKQQTLAYQQKTLSNYDVMDKTLKAQVAVTTVRGVSLSSPSFNAIQRDTVNSGAKIQRNLDIEDDISQQNFATEKENVRNTLFAQLFGDVADVSMNAASFTNAAPKAGKVA